MMLSVAQMLVTASNWVSSLNALLIAGKFTTSPSLSPAMAQGVTFSMVCTIKVVKELHLWKVAFPMLVTDDEIVRLDIEMH